MAKKFGKFLLFSLFAGAAAAGTWYFLKDRTEEDLFEDSEPDVNDELEEFLKDETEKAPDQSIKTREYVPLNFSKEAVQDATEETGSNEEPDTTEETVAAEAEIPEETPEEGAATDIEVTLEDTAEKVGSGSEKIIGNPAETAKNNVEKGSEPDDDRISTFSFSSFE